MLAPSLGSGYSPNTGARWRGFNLQEKFTNSPDEWARVAPEWGRSNEPFRESDFHAIARWGFNFVRLPMSYRCWTDISDPYVLKEKTLQEIDDAVRWGREYGVHVCINFHRAPGYCINQALLPEPWDLWTEGTALDIFCHHWTRFAQRYKGIPNSVLSFNLINEPSRCTLEQYERVIRAAVQAIREVDSSRLLMIDGMFGEAILPAMKLIDIPSCIHATRGYAPFALSHYRAPWAGTPDKLPEWPMPVSETVVWNKPMLQRWCVQPFEELVKNNVPVFVGEWGCWNKTPHEVTLAWMRDFLTLWKQVSWGWALWCFRGSFGVLDSDRNDVAYERWRGHRLDRKMLELLREY